MYDIHTYSTLLEIAYRHAHGYTLVSRPEHAGYDMVIRWHARLGVVSAKGVLAVPVEAIVALAEGGFAVEVIDGATTHYVRVTLGAFADGMVEIDGDVAEGQNVVVP